MEFAPISRLFRPPCSACPNLGKLTESAGAWLVGWKRLSKASGPAEARSDSVSHHLK